MNNPVVSQKEWLKARKALLRDEKALTRLSDQLAARRRRLPWLKLESEYKFDDEHGTVSLGDLFEGRSQLIIYHFMFGPDWTEGCVGCTSFADDFNGIVEYLNNRDASMVVVSRASLTKLLAYKQRMDWRFRWVSSEHSEFNYDFHVSFRDPGPSRKFFNFSNYDNVELEENHGLSVFRKDDDGQIFHTYSCYARSVDPLSTSYQLLDLLPNGRSDSPGDHNFRRA